MLSPVQVGVGVKGGAEAAVHATRRYIDSIRDSPDRAIVKLDFKNAFNCLRRDCMLEAVLQWIPELYAFCHNAYSGHPVIMFNDTAIESATGAQQGDPLGPLLFSITLHPILMGCTSEFRIGYLDDVTLGGLIQDVDGDVQRVRQEACLIGLDLNPGKCEIISNISESDAESLTFEGFKHVYWDEAELLGSPLTRGANQNRILEAKCSELAKAMTRSQLLDSHYSLSIISNCISAPKLLYIIRTSYCVDNDLLARFDVIVRAGLGEVLNVQLSDDQWLQSSLPVREGGLGVRSVVSLAPSAFLASAVSTRPLQQEILPFFFQFPDVTFDCCLARWSELTSAAPVDGPAATRQRSWDAHMVGVMRQHLMSVCCSDLDRARILAVSAPHSGDWLHATPSANCGLFLENEELRVAVCVRIGATICVPHDCSCGTKVDAQGLHGFSCKKGAGKHIRHSLLNDTVWRSFLRAKIQAQKEPAGLSVFTRGQNGTTSLKRPDGATLIPWKRGRSVTWDVTVADTFATSYLPLTSLEAGSAAERAASLKNKKYEELARNHIFIPLACEVTGNWCSEAVEFLHELGDRISAVTGDRRESTFLFQRLSVALQKGNAACIIGTMPTEPQD
jgi:hypothetical protein